MEAIQYRYNTTTCQYEPIRTTPGKLCWHIVRFLSFSGLLAAGILAIYSTYFDSPKEAKLKAENATLRSYYTLIQKEIEQGNKILDYLQHRDDDLYSTIFEIAPLAPAVRRAGIGGTQRYNSLTQQEPLITHTLEKVEQLKRKLYIQSRSYDRIEQLAKEQEKRLAAIPAIQPIYNKQLHRLSSPFGMRLHPITKQPKMHQGVDFAAKAGTPIYATGNGKVRLIRAESRGYGKQIEIDHGYGFVTKYAHMQSFNVTYGQNVKRGQCIGYVGSTGLAKGPHLHYEVIKHGKKINPIHYFFNELTPVEYEKLLEIAAKGHQSLCLN